jgi:hypothetical protein
MTLVALLISLFVAALGALALLAPKPFVRLMRAFETPAGLYVTAAIRLVFGVALVFAAPGSRSPLVIWILGMIIFVAGLATLMVSLDRFKRLLEWWLAKGAGFWRAWGAVVLGLALLLAYTIAPWWR